MFTGIIQQFGTVKDVIEEGSNLHFWIESGLSSELKIDQSVAHNGICLTVIDIKEGSYCVTAVEETILKTTIGSWKKGDRVNLELGMRLNDRLDGHIVQGHVDTVAELVKVKQSEGSWIFEFKYPKEFASLIIPKGSICINGVSLTVIDPSFEQFSVTIIPFTFEHTNFSDLIPGQKVNLEFDILGKYILRNEQIKTA